MAPWLMQWISTVPGFNNFWGAAASVGGGVAGAASGVVTGGLIFIINRMPPGGGFPVQVHDAATYFGHTLAYVNFILPVDALVWCLSIVFLVKMILWAFHIALVIVNFLRGVPTQPFVWQTDTTTITPKGSRAVSVISSRRRIGGGGW